MNFVKATRVVGKTNNSLYVTLPPEIIKAFDIHKGDSLMFQISGGKIIAEVDTKKTARACSTSNHINNN